MCEAQGRQQGGSTLAAWLGGAGRRLPSFLMLGDGGAAGSRRLPRGLGARRLQPQGAGAAAGAGCGAPAAALLGGRCGARRRSCSLSIAGRASFWPEVCMLCWFFLVYAASLMCHIFGRRAGKAPFAPGCVSGFLPRRPLSGRRAGGAGGAGDPAAAPAQPPVGLPVWLPEGGAAARYLPGSCRAVNPQRCGSGGARHGCACLTPAAC